MSILEWVLLIIFIVLLMGIVVMLFMTMPIAKRVYFAQLVRTSKEKWGYKCSALNNEEQVTMWNEGLAWGEKHKDIMEEKHIVNEGFNLYGQFFDFKAKQTIIIVPGREECHMYSLYFAQTYTNKFNVFVFDTRSHGASDGIYNTAGIKEFRDLLAWAKYLHDEKQQEIIFHGICMGAATCVYAASDNACPNYIKGLINDGCFTTFYETFKQHMIVDKRPVHPVIDEIRFYQKKFSGVDIKTDSPLNCIGHVKMPVLFLYGVLDIYSRPEKTRILFNKCGSENKKLVWFDKGLHSHLRINNTEMYDEEIMKFIGVVNNE